MGRQLERPCATICNLVGFITTVSLMANTHCMTDVGRGTSLATHANRAVNGLPGHAVVCHLLSVVQAGTND